jgi:hypothetical protein
MIPKKGDEAGTSRKRAQNKVIAANNETTDRPALVMNTSSWFKPPATLSAVRFPAFPE